MLRNTIYAVISNDVALTPAALFDDRDRFRAEPSDGARAWGLGSVQDRRALVKRRPKLGNHVFDFAALASDAPSRVVVGALIADDAPPPRTDAIPPFRFQNWVLAPRPTRARFLEAELRHRVRDLVPDHVRRTLEGESDGELMSHAMIGGLGLHAAARTPDFPVELVDDLIIASMTELRVLLGDEVPLDLLVSNGRVLWAIADSTPLWFRWFEGLDDDPMVRAERKRMALAPKPTPRPHFRALVVTSAKSEEHGWTRLDVGQRLLFVATDPPRVLPN